MESMLRVQSNAPIPAARGDDSSLPAETIDQTFR
jgi:hypothetical protein